MDREKKFIYLKEEAEVEEVKAKEGDSDEEQLQRPFLDASSSQQNSMVDGYFNEMYSLTSSVDGKEVLKLMVERMYLNDSLAFSLLKYLTSIQLDYGCVLVDKPKLQVSSMKFEVKRYVSPAQMRKFLCTTDVLPEKSPDLGVDWSFIIMYRLLFGKREANAVDEEDERVKSCQIYAASAMKIKALCATAIAIRQTFGNDKVAALVNKSLGDLCEEWKD